MTSRYSVNQPQITQINTDLKNTFLALKYQSLVTQLIFTIFLYLILLNL
ncbi:hypothetical protein SBF1_1490003 [Candidatus Desulfosporosinus infrequens]|uniref:Uncharacterized protein n=1 Tax=Candidatus Desulfosporosinus infrequens TaxID=2043169 RepID=A0A2U3K6X5_9FIRM|nr:hypothetical protein SBF1_1490003 [Candidatus Desulfosporosinus infrequens]